MCGGHSKRERKRCTAGHLVSATSRPITPPMARNTTAATALTMISRCAAMSTLSPVNRQVRKLNGRAGAPSAGKSVAVG